MSDYSPPPRAGYTRTGKSIKAVKRYYAQKNSPKKKKSPDDEKLSKRIAAELKVQQEANKKRNRQTGNFEIEPTERSSIPIIMQPREVGPTFVTSPKSVKSAKSVGTVAQIVENPANFIHTFSNSSDGCLVACIVLAIIYVVTWLFMFVISYYKRNMNYLAADSQRYSSMSEIRWVALTSIGVILIVPYWFALRNRFKHALIALMSMIICSISLMVHLVYHIVKDDSSTAPRLGREYYLGHKDPLNFWLPITYLLFTLVSDSLMIKQLLNLVSRQIEGKSNNHSNSNRANDGGQIPAMSQYLSPA